MEKIFQVEVKDNIIPLPEKFSSGIVRRLKEGCLLVVPQRKSKALFISKEEREFAGIGERALLVDCGRYYEIWNPEKFREFEKETEPYFEEIAERLIIDP